MCSAVIKGAVADIGHRPYGLACGEVVRFILSSHAGEDCSRVLPRPLAGRCLSRLRLGEPATIRDGHVRFWSE